MLTITSAQLDAWLALFMFPLARILGLVATAPVFGNAALSLTVRLVLGLSVSLALAPALPPMPSVPAGSWVGLAILGQQALIGILIGFTLQLILTAIDLAGELIGLQMGLSFAMFYDPTNGAQTPVITELLSLISTLIFLAMNGHLLCLSALAESFTLMPVSATPFAAKGFWTLVSAAGAIFASGMLISLPMIAALLVANLALGVLSRVAPTLNLFAVGFPVTIFGGFTVLILSLPYLGNALGNLYDRGFSTLGVVLRGGLSAGGVLP